MTAAVEQLALRRFEAMYERLDEALDAEDAEAVAELVEARGALVDELLATYDASCQVPPALAARIASREHVLRARMAALRGRLHAAMSKQRSRGRAVMRYAQQDKTADTRGGQRR